MNSNRLSHANSSTAFWGRLERPSAVIGTDRQNQSEFDEVLLSCLTEEAAKRNWQLVELEYFGGAVPEGLDLDGAFVRALPGSHRLAELRQHTTNIIRLGSAPHPDDKSLPALLPDLAAQGVLAVQHFSERGFQHIGCVGREPWSISVNLYRGAQRAAAESGLELHLLRLPAWSETKQTTAELALDSFNNWIRQVPKPIGLICPSDYFAAKFCAWARAAGVRVPTDVAILGIGNKSAICNRSLPRLSSIDMSEYQRGIAACDLMAGLLAGQAPPLDPVMIPPSGITVRESTDVLATVDSTVADALLHMWPNIANDLSVDDIAEHVGIHRRKLERAFRAELGRGVNAELLRRRLERSGELLRETDLTVADISALTGFRSDDYFYRAFRRSFGATPIQWRKAQQ